MDHKFSIYIENFKNSLRILNTYIRQLESSKERNDVKYQIMVSIDEEFAEAEGYLAAMTSYIKGNNDQYQVKQNINQCNEEYTLLKQYYQKLKLKLEHTQNSPSKSRINPSLISSNQRVDDTTKVLEQSRNIIYDTENIGTSILSDMDQQKVKLLDSHTYVKDTQTLSSQAKRALNMLSLKSTLNKIGVYFVAIILFIAIILVFYYGVILRKM